MKECFKCHEKKPLSEFYKHPRMADGHVNKCKDCARSDALRHRAKNYDAVLERERRTRRRNGRRYSPEAIAKYNRLHPDRAKAHRALKNAIRDGRLIKQPCEICGSLNVHGHHEDYAKPLDVRWLCALHHMRVHAGLLDLEPASPVVPALSTHARIWWDERFSSLDLAEQWSSRRRPGWKLHKNIRMQCPVSGGEYRPDAEHYMLTPDTNIVWVVSRVDHSIISVFKLQA